MQITEQDLERAVSEAATNTEGEPDTHLTPEEADEIFKRAEAEIKPLLRKMRRDTLVQNLLEIVCWFWIVASLVGMVYQIVTYPHTLVLLVTKTRPAEITTTLDISTRTLAPVTITRSATRATTGTGHQDARAASGTLTFYNGNASPQTIASGTVLTGSDGVQVRTDQAVTIPAANPPYLGQATIPATTLQTGSRTNMHAFEMNGTVSGSVFVKNLSAFTGGRDARTYRAVAAKDVQTLTSTLNATVTQVFTTAFSVQPGEAAIPINCTTKATPSHQTGEEAQSVTLTIAKTCSAVAYNQSQLSRAATTAFTRTRPASTYHLVGSIQTTLLRVSPLAVRLSGQWAYTFSPDYEQQLAQDIQGDSPTKARTSLLKTGVISYANVPRALPWAGYIDFVVLVR